MSNPAIRRAGRRFLLALAPLLLVLEVLGAAELLRRPDLGFRLRHDQIMQIEAGGPADRAGLHVGDRIVAIDGRRVTSYADLVAALHGRRAGERLSLEGRRRGRSIRVPLELAERSPRERGLALVQSLSALAFLFLGFVTYLRRADALGRTFYVTCLLLAHPFLDLPSVSDPTVMRWSEGIRDALVGFMPAFLLRLVWIFPEGAEGDPWRYRRQRWIFLPPALLAPLHLLSHFESLPTAGLEALAAVTAMLFAAYVLAAVVVFAKKIRRRQGWTRTAQLRLALTGLVAGVAPLTLTTLLRQFLPAHAPLLDTAAVLFLPLVPASFSLALLRAGALDLAYLMRQALIAFFLALPILVLTVVTLGALDRAPGPGLRPLLYAGVLVALAGIAVGSRTPARWIARGVDRFFYPEQRRVRAAATRLGRRLTEQRDPDQVRALLGDGLVDLLTASSVAVLEPADEDRWTVTHRSGDPNAPVPSTDDALLNRASATRDVVCLDAAGAGPRDAPVLFAPLVAAGRVLAVVAVGPPRQRNDYSALHLFHVQSLCRQAAAALENARLHREDLARERDRTELTLARQIQRRLLPSKDLVHDEYVFSGNTESCRSVGGDLFDHFRLSDGTLVGVVADAAGKGVPASLLTSGLRTAVRETIRPGLPLDQAVSHVNAHVCGMTTEGSFIALFVALLDPRTGMVDYCVGGIEPPLWLHARDRRVEPLTRGGPVLGIDPAAGYHVGTILLEPGDALFAFSDGLIDEENAEGEEFGRERLIRAILAQRGVAARQALESLLGAVRMHRAGEPVDDTTLLVVRRAARMTAGMAHADHEIDKREDGQGWGNLTILDDLEGGRS